MSTKSTQFWNGSDHERLMEILHGYHHATILFSDGRKHLMCVQEEQLSTRENLVETLRMLGPEHVVDGMELCPACDALSPGISTHGETIMHCGLCRDAGLVTVEEANRWRQAMQKKYGSK